MSASTRLPHWLLAGLALAAAVVFVPFLPWIVLALWLGLFARRIQVPLARKLGGREKLAAAVTVSLLLVIAIPIAAVMVKLIFEAIGLVELILKSDRAQGALSTLVSSKSAGPTATSTAHSVALTADSAMKLLMDQGGRALGIATTVFGAAASFVVGILVMVTGMYGVLTEGRGWYEWAERHAPLTPEHFKRFGAAFLETGRGLWWGIVGAGVLQSTVATVTYLLLGVPSGLALGMLTLVFSVVPAIGTAFVWVPVAIGLAVVGQTGSGIVMAVVGIFVIGTVDNFARPWLAHRGELKLPTWVVLVTMFGGIEVIGAWGLVLGPLAVRLAKEALAISREAHDPATAPTAEV